MTDNRARERWTLRDFQQILDADTDELVGYLGDVSIDGLKMLRKEPFPIGETRRFKLFYVFSGGRHEAPVIEAESLWDRTEDDLPFREIGFRLSALSDDARASVERIVSDLRARDSGG